MIKTYLIDEMWKIAASLKFESIPQEAVLGAGWTA